MDALEEIEAAVKKLTNLKKKSTQGAWRLDGPDYHFYGENDGDFVNTSLISNDERVGIVQAMAPWHRKNEDSYSAWASTAEFDMVLVVTLRQTIEAQLAILQAATDAYNDENLEKRPGLASAAFTLARAINGNRAPHRGQQIL